MASRDVSILITRENDENKNRINELLDNPEADFFGLSNTSNLLSHEFKKLTCKDYHNFYENDPIKLSIVNRFIKKENSDTSALHLICGEIQHFVTRSLCRQCRKKFDVCECVVQTDNPTWWIPPNCDNVNDDDGRKKCAYVRDKEEFHLFIASLLTDRFESARFFWRRCDFPIANGLIANTILQRLLKLGIYEHYEHYEEIWDWSWSLQRHDRGAALQMRRSIASSNQIFADARNADSWRHFLSGIGHQRRPKRLFPHQSGTSRSTFLYRVFHIKWNIRKWCHSDFENDKTILKKRFQKLLSSNFSCKILIGMCQLVWLQYWF